MSEVVQLMVLLQNFDSDVEVLEMDNRTDLRRTSEEELGKLRKLGLKFARSGLLTPRVKYVIDTRFRLDEVSPEEYPWNMEDWQYIREMIHALRLLHDGDVNATGSFWLEGDEVTGLSYPERGHMFLENPYFLKKQEAPSFKKLWKAIQKMKEDKAYLVFPLEQFMKAFEKRAAGFDDEATIDYAVALESLVFHNEEQSIHPAGKVIGIAIGMLLGHNEKERIKVRKSLEKTYEIRNALVHGNTRKIQKYESELTKASAKTENYLRTALRLLIEE